MLPTLAEVLELPALQRARPRVVVGRDRLDVPVRWVHIAEVTDLAHLLRGGELVLSTSSPPRSRWARSVTSAMWTQRTATSRYSEPATTRGLAFWRAGS